MDLVGAGNRAIFNNLIGVDAHDTFNQQVVIWRKFMYGLDQYGEDNKNAQFSDIPLKGLFSYNYFRQWAIDQSTVSGEIDKQAEAVLFSIEYLKGLSPSPLDANDFWDFELLRDRFIHKGVIYIVKGSTFISQSQDKPLLIMIILKREETETADTAGGH